MKKFINSVDAMLAESLDGFAAAHSDIVTLGAERKFVRRRSHSSPAVAAVMSHCMPDLLARVCWTLSVLGRY